jgi:hypothetical protein
VADKASEQGECLELPRRKQERSKPGAPSRGARQRRSDLAGSMPQAGLTTHDRTVRLFVAS